jgi:hypothetical protein
MTDLGKIYKITCNDTGDVYYGSTKQPLSTRKTEHKSGVKRYDEGKITSKLSCYDIVKNNNFKIELVEEVPLENLKQREKYYIQNFKCVNQISPFATKEDVKAWAKKSREKNSEYYKAHNKEYREKNREMLIAYCKEYRQKNRDKINEKVKCECGSCVKKYNLSEHYKTKKHLEFNKKNNI